VKVVMCDTGSFFIYVIIIIVVVVVVVVVVVMVIGVHYYDTITKNYLDSEAADN
jgi:uncharacterized membrane protein